MIEIKLQLTEQFLTEYFDPRLARDRRLKMQEELHRALLSALAGTVPIVAYAPDDARLKKLRDEAKKGPADAGPA
jgi:hypothetical protein